MFLWDVLPPQLSLRSDRHWQLPFRIILTLHLSVLLMGCEPQPGMNKAQPSALAKPSSLPAQAPSGIGWSSKPSTSFQEVADPRNTIDPVLSAPRQRVDLGEVNVGDFRSIPFPIQNHSPNRSRVQIVHKSCSCIKVSIDPPVLEPQQIGQVVFQWEADLEQLALAEELQVRMTADVQAEGGQPIRFEATARYKPTLMVSLPQGRLDFGQLDAADLKVGAKAVVFEIYSRADGGQSLNLDVRSSHPGLTVDEAQPLSPERLAILKANHGYRIRVVPNPRLATGPFREQVVIHSPSSRKPMNMSVSGHVVSGAVHLSSENINLAAAQLSMSRGYRSAPLRIRLRYEPGRSLTLQSVAPRLLHAELKPVKDNEWDLILFMPPATDAVWANIGKEDLHEWLSYGIPDGEVILSSDHSQVSQLRIPIIGSRLRP